MVKIHQDFCQTAKEKKRNIMYQEDQSKSHVFGQYSHSPYWQKAEVVKAFKKNASLITAEFVNVVH